VATVVSNVLDLDPQDVLAELAAKAGSQAGSENFPVALRVVPAAPREHLSRLYGYARFVDDVGDEAPGDRRHLLDLVEADLRHGWTGRSALAPLAALAPTIEACAVPMQPLLDLIGANRADQEKTSYQTYADLIAYCVLSANPIGQVVLYIAGAVTAQNLAESDAVCSALQVLEHCQDVGEDFARDRVYLPAVDLAAAGVTRAELGGTTTSPALRDVLRLQVERAETGLAAGTALVHRLRGWARFAVAGYVGGGLATVDALRSADFDVLGRSVRPSKARTAAHAARLVVGL
jgi:squalene synthase HpnC